MIRAAINFDRAMALSLLHATEGRTDFSVDETILLLADSLFQVTGHDAWTWEQLANGVAALAPQALATALIARIRGAAPQHRLTTWASTEATHVLSACIANAPSIAIELLALWEQDERFVEGLGTELADAVGSRGLAEWATDDRRQAALARLTSAVPQPLTSDLMSRFGAESVFAAKLRGAQHPRWWSGSLAEALRTRAVIVRAASAGPNVSAEFQTWANATAAWLETAAERAGDDET